jgi:hypothetical protein
MQQVHKPITGVSATNRSKMTNGSKLLDGVDGRSSEARRFRDILRGYQTRFPSATEEECRVATMLQLRLEQMQSQLVRGEPVDDGVMLTTARTHQHLVAALKGENVPPSDMRYRSGSDEEDDD